MSRSLVPPSTRTRGGGSIMRLLSIALLALLALAIAGDAARSGSGSGSSGASPSADSAPHFSTAAAAAAVQRNTQLLSRLSSHTLATPSPHGSHATLGAHADQGFFPPSYSFRLAALNKEFEIKLKKNSDMIDKKGYQHIKLDYGGGAKKGLPTRLVSATTDSSVPRATRNCYYHGSVVGDPQSWVALSTCHGISGVVHAHGETFAITPDMMDAASQAEEGASGNAGRRARSQSALRHMNSLSASAEEQHEKMVHQHIVYRLSDYKPLKTVCGVTEENENPLKMMQQQAVKAQRKATPATAAASASSSSSSSRSAAPRLGSNGNPGDMRYIEMLVINDYDRHQRLGDNTEHETLSLINMVDSFYRTTNFKYKYRIVLVGQVTFTNGDPYHIPYLDGPAANPPRQPGNSRPTPYQPAPWTPRDTVPTPKPQPEPEPEPTPTPSDPNSNSTDSNVPAEPADPDELDYSSFPPELQYLIPDIKKNLAERKAKAAQQKLADAQPVRALGAAVQTQGQMGLLEVFNAWHAGERSLPKRDNTQLFSGLNFASGVLGLANVGMSCFPEYAGSVCELNEPSDVQNAVIAAHETGHTIGMTHDSMGNNCPSSGYIMASVAGVGNTFSTCSIDYLDKWADSHEQGTPNTCLNNEPEVWLNRAEDEEHPEKEPEPEGKKPEKEPESESEQEPKPELEQDTPVPTPRINANETEADAGSEVDAESDVEIDAESEAINVRKMIKMQQAHQATMFASQQQQQREAVADAAAGDSYRLMLTGGGCFLAGLAAAYAISQMRNKKLLGGSSKQSSPAPTKAGSPSLALNVAPSQPSTPMHANNSHGHPHAHAEPESGSMKRVPSATSSLMHLTKATRRPSLGGGAHVHAPAAAASTTYEEMMATIPSESPEVESD